MLTIFAMPKHFKGHFNVIQRNAIQSWMRLKSCEIILFGDDDGTAEAASDFGARHCPEIARNEHGTPLLHDIFEKAQRLSRNRLLCFINSDIILLSDFPGAFRGVPFRRFLLAGQRWDMQVDRPLDFTEPDWEAQLRTRLAADAELHSPDGIDYFVFTRGLWGRLPPFAIGRPAYDNWLIYKARARRSAVIDATQAITVIHQNHDYSHARNGWQTVWEGPEAIRNKELAGGKKKFFTLLNATHLLTARGLQRPRTPAHRQKQEAAWPTLHPWLHFFRETGRMVFGLPRRLAGAALRRARRRYAKKKS